MYAVNTSYALYKLIAIAVQKFDIFFWFLQQTYKRLSVLGVCPAYGTVLRTVDRLCNHFDQHVMKWKTNLEIQVHTKFSEIDTAAI